ncbi:MAG: hypothetical protein LUF29_02310 [Oscillospiraceae bacterium]|nr:hypothetical protein [Oscillospiraceae bacterium]
MAKKLLCVLLSVLMVVSLLPMGVSADASNYSKIWVNGVDLLTVSDYTVQCGDGTAVFDPSTDTLTLTNATIVCYPTSSTSKSYYGITINCTNSNSPANGLTIKLVGDNTIVPNAAATNNYGICANYCQLQVISTNNGTLTGDGLYRGLYITGRSLSISDCTLTFTNTTYAGIQTSTNYTFDVTNSTVTITGTKYGIYGSATGTFTDSAIDITTTDKCIYSSLQTLSATTSAYTVDNSQLTCTVTTSGTPAIEACGFTVTGNSTVIADGGINMALGTSTNYNKYAHVIMSTEPAYFYYGSDASNLSALGTSTSARSYTGSTVATTYGYSKYAYIKIVTGTGNGGPTPTVVAGADGIFGLIYVNEDYHGLVITRNGRRFLISIPHDDANGDGICDTCHEQFSDGEEEAVETVTVGDVTYEVAYSYDKSISASNWTQVELDDLGLIEALAEDGAILVITRDSATSTSYANGDYEKFLLIDSWWSNDNKTIALGTAGHTSADEEDLIDCLSDDGTTAIYDGATIYAAWEAGNYAAGGDKLVFISNTSASYKITSIQVLIPVD